MTGKHERALWRSGITGWLVALSLLQGCSSLSRHEERNKQTAPLFMPEASRPLTPVTRRIIDISRDELQRWNQLPPPRERIAQYWHAVAPGLADKHMPWSAAFIAYVMHRAGIPASIFPPSGAHWIYLQHIHAQANPSRMAGMSLHGLDRYRPQAGDLICAKRDHHHQLDVDSPVFHRQLHGSHLHCDIVTARYAGFLEVIGGNVSHRVSIRRIPLDPRGFLSVSNEDWFSVVENRL